MASNFKFSKGKKFGRSGKWKGLKTKKTEINRTPKKISGWAISSFGKSGNILKINERDKREIIAVPPTISSDSISKE